MRKYHEVRQQFGFTGDIGDTPLTAEAILEKRKPFKEELLPARKLLQKVMFVLVILLFMGGMAVAAMLLGIVFGHVTGNQVVTKDFEQMVVFPSAGAVILALSFIFVFSKKIRRLDAKYYALKDFEYVGVSLPHLLNHQTGGPKFLDGESRYFDAVEDLMKDSRCQSYIERVAELDRLLIMGEFNKLAKLYLESRGANAADQTNVYSPTKRAENYLDLLEGIKNSNIVAYGTLNNT